MPYTLLVVMYNSLKKIDFERTLYWELKYGGYKLNELYKFGMISPNVIRAVEIGEYVMEQCYIENRSKLDIEVELSNRYKISQESIKKICKGIFQYVKT